MRKHLRLVSAMVACLAVSGSLAAASSASAAPAWSPGGATYWTGKITLELNGGSPVVCETANNNGTIPSWTANSTGSLTAFTNFAVRAFCPLGKEFTLTALGTASGSGPFTETLTNTWAMNTSQLSPFGRFTEPAAMAAAGSVTNGSGSTPTTVTFSKVAIGKRESDGLPITLSGTLNVTTSTGGLMTLK